MVVVQLHRRVIRLTCLANLATTSCLLLVTARAHNSFALAVGVNTIR